MMRACLSRDQLCFAVLLEGHAHACQYLFSLVVEALKAAYPSTWKDVVCSCFGHGVGQHIKQDLDDGLAITDFYAVCKTTRKQLQNVANLCRGELLDPYERERLSLQMQGVETARHWLFHGEQYVSVRELRSSMALLVTLLRSLSQKPDRSFSVRNKLMSLLLYAEDLTTLKPDGECKLSSVAVRSALLQSALVEFKRNFKAYFQQRDANSNKTVKKKAKVGRRQPGGHDDYRDVFSEIRKAASDLMTKTNGKGRVVSAEDQPLSLIDMCKTVSDLRNASAHGKPLTLSETKSGVSRICRLLAAFHLSSEQATAIMKQLNRLPDDKDHEAYFCSILRDKTSQNDFKREANSARMFRSARSYFVGRQQERFVVVSALQGGAQGSAIKSKVLVCGPPGIGKSYLAAEVADSLRNTFKTQTWLSCSKSCHLQQDLKIASELSFHSKVAHSVPHLSTDISRRFIDENCPDLDNYGLVILDDVCLSTVCLVYKIITKSSCSVVVTTKSPAVRCILQSWLSSLRIIRLKPFSLRESVELAEIKGNVSEMDEETLVSFKKIVCGILGNLPLSVSVYSLMVGTCLRKPEKKQFDIFDERLVLEKWEDIEEQFGDRFHVRGFAGVVQSAETYLRKYPLVTFLLAKICLVDSEYIPWEVVQGKPVGGKVRLEFDLESKWLRKLVYGVLGVTDWLFSEAGRKRLELCRFQLEDLGLISWQKSTNTVHIHRLTLRSAQKLLAESKLFICDLVSLRVQDCVAGQNKDNFEDAVSYCISLELQASVLDRCAQILRESASSLQSDHLDELAHTYPAFAILKQLVELSRPTVEEVWRMDVEFQVDTTFILLDYMSRFDLLISDSLFLYFKRILKFSSSSGSRAYGDDYRPRLMFHELSATRFLIAGKIKEAFVSLQNLLGLIAAQFGATSDFAAEIHCRIAYCIQTESGRIARKEYVRAVARKCPHLMALVDVENLLHELSYVKYLERDEFYVSKDSIRLRILWDAVQYRIEDDMKDFGRVSSNTLEAAHTLIDIYQQKQKLALELANKVPSNSVGPHCEEWVDGHFENWVKSALRVNVLLMKTQESGKYIRAAIQHSTVIASHLLSSSSLSKFDSCYLSIIKVMVTLWIRSSWFVGHYSLAVELCRKVVGSLPLLHPSPQSFKPGKKVEKKIEKMETVVKPSHNGENVAWLTLSFTLAKDIQNMHETLNFEPTQSCFLHFFNERLHLGHEGCDWLGKFALRKTVMLSSLLGGTFADDAVTKLRVWAESERISWSWKIALRNAAHKIIKKTKQGELCAVCEDFRNSRKALQNGNYLSVRYFSLRCWKNLFRLDCLGTSLFDSLFLSMVLELADNLQHWYSSGDNFTLAEWFCAVRFRLSRVARRHFLAAKYGMELVEFLKQRGRLSEALEQCCAVQRLLVGKFGNEYSEWLPNAPPVTASLQQLLDDGAREMSEEGSSSADKSRAQVFSREEN